MATDFVDSARHWSSAQTAADVRIVRLVHLPADRPPWTGTGLHMAAGTEYSLFAGGRVHWSPHRPTLYGGPRHHLWARLSPGGRIVNSTGDSGTFVADVDGELELCIYMGMWKNEHGDLATPTSLYRHLSGGLDVLAVVWQDGAAVALERAAAVGAPPFIGTELERLKSAPSVPVGWSYLLETGQASIFADAVGPSGEPTIAVDSRDDQGIVCKAVEAALTPQTRLRWRWRVTEHPSELAEDRAQTHDYVSVATEFDNGRDLTWIWSSRLPPGTHFHCPVRAWTERETHWVVRSGRADLGLWCTEEREVYADVRSAMGEPPSHIVRVWLIAVSSFQHGTARAEFSDIVLSDGGSTLRVL